MPTLNRRLFLGCLLAASAAPWLSSPAVAASPIKMELWTAPGCGCCHDWVSHLEANGFSVTVHDGGNTAQRRKLGLPDQYASCHTGVVAGYAIEGHVPARDIQRLLRERPQAIGLAVPAMPIGSPGMDGPAYQGRKDPYEVLLVRKDGRTSIFQSYPKA